VGTLAPVRGVDVTTEIAGLVREVRFKSGDEVKAGQVLFELNADSDVAQLRALQAAADLSGTTLKRDKLQLAAQAISQAQVDADEADLKSKQALVAQQKALVDKKTIRAPFAGKLGITAVNPGQYLNPGDKLVTLQTIDTVYVDFLRAAKAAGQPVHRPEAEPDQRRLSWRGIPGQGDVHQSESGCRHPQRAGAGHRANAKRQLLPGMFANVSLDQGDMKNT
jgi:membrane fusion protein (multidrug efflux system)